MTSSNSESKEFTVILPTLNEGATIARMIDRITELYPGAEILVVDDGSTDGTVSKVRRLVRVKEGVSLIQRDVLDRGLTASIMDGIRRTETDYFVVMDSDFQHPPESVGDIIDSLLEGNDLTIGVRETRNELPIGRKLSSVGAHKLANIYLRLKGKPLSKDTMSGFFGGRTDLFKRIIDKHGSEFERRGFKVLFDFLKFMPGDARIDEVEFAFGERMGGESKLDSRVVLSILRQCGLAGKGLATASSFLLLTMMGRFTATIILGLSATFAVLSVTGVDWTTTTALSTFLSFILAMVYLTIATEFSISDNRRIKTLAEGAKLVSISLIGYILTLYVFYTISAELTLLQALSTLLGFIIALSWNILGCSIPTD